MAEDILRQQEVGSFLIRDSKAGSPGLCQVLSVRATEGFLHLKIERQAGKLVLGGRGALSLMFPDIQSIVQHYSRHHIRLRGGRRIRLCQPALERLL